MSKLNFNLLSSTPEKNDNNKSIIKILDDLGKEICEKGNGYFFHTITTTGSDNLIFDFSLYIIVPEISYEYRVVNVEILNINELMVNFFTLVTKQVEKDKIDISGGNDLYEEHLIKLFTNSLFIQSLQFLINQVNLKKEYSKSVEKKIVEGEARILKLKDGTRMNAGFIKKENNEVIFYTGLGLRTLWRTTTKEEKEEADRLQKLGKKKLERLKYIGRVNIDDIEEIY